MKFVEFIVDNWRIILEFCLCICSAILFIIRRKNIKLVDSVKTLIIEFLPSVINKVEDVPDHLTSIQKLELALSIVQSYCTDILDMTESDFLLYRDWITQRIEEILTTPQKKG